MACKDWWQEQFDRCGQTLQAVLELNTLDAFRGVVRQGNLIALLPQSALMEKSLGPPTLAVRPTQSPVLTRRVVLGRQRPRSQSHHPPYPALC